MCQIRAGGGYMRVEELSEIHEKGIEQKREERK